MSFASGSLNYQFASLSSATSFHNFRGPKMCLSFDRSANVKNALLQMSIEFMRPNAVGDLAVQGV